jgi:hypothetical protein
MKTIIALLLSVFAAAAQSYSLSTNLTFTNTIESGVTLTYTGTNCLDVTRYQSFAIVATGYGTNTSTNAISFTFLAGPTTTNWETIPSITLSGTSYGTNGFYIVTNLTAGNGIGYVKPYQIVSSLTNTVTNAYTWGALKTFPRN